MDVGEKIMESSAVPDMRRFEFHADDKAKEATVCMSKRQEEALYYELPGLQSAC